MEENHLSILLFFSKPSITLSFMIEFEEAVEMLDGTSIEKAVRNMHAFFCSVEESITPFSEKEGVSCPKGCGTCCEKFLPGDSTA